MTEMICHTPACCCQDQPNPPLRLEQSEMRLCRVEPGEHAYEAHPATEFIVCLQGALLLEDADGGRVQADPGEVIEIPAGVRHRFAPPCDAAIMRLTPQLSA
ncbi:cupin domain-containing protein [Crenobacter intestini]|uniref:Cupin domain-containing protein n=1 Tax=Crenobacter intestini TaxID=2563443 RepID=A0A4T0V591_9NEIS|nr:cupin domain-containing protein [Crenobacter intestini]TIC86904.1 cupin domain-containing protein [Crenobacter intestini]